MAEVKCCGLTRAEDVAHAVALGAAYTGVIFAGGPRLLTPDRAREVLRPAEGSVVKRVGVFGQQHTDEVLEIAQHVALDVLQLSRGGDRPLRLGLRDMFKGALWAVVHIGPSAPLSVDSALRWFDEGIDALVLDAAVPGQLGGTGVALDWAALGPDIQRVQRRGTVVLAGGLRPSNVAHALALTGADVLDVSSGVESAPGIKDPELMRAFVSAARAHEVR